MSLSPFLIDRIITILHHVTKISTKYNIVWGYQPMEGAQIVWTSIHKHVHISVHPVQLSCLSPWCFVDEGAQHCEAL